MYGLIPEAFSQVVLSDRRTWHRATCREWLDLRSDLKYRAEEQDALQHLEEVKLNAMFEVQKILSKEMGIHSDSPRPPKGGDVDKRRKQLMDELFYKKHPEYQPLSRWEREFLDTSAWVDDALEAYERRRGTKDPTAILFEWLITVEDSLGLAERRKLERESAIRSISRRSRRSPKRTNLYYPRPIELIYIYKSAMTIFHNIKEDFKTYLSYGDPVPNTQSKLDMELGDFLRDNRHEKLAVRFSQQLKAYGYVPYQDEEDCIQWGQWKAAISKYTTAIATRRYLAFLFKVKESTIKRDLSKSSLDAMYDEFGVEGRFRQYLDGKGAVSSSLLYRQGWYLRLEDGAPSRFDWGISYYPQDHP